MPVSEKTVLDIQFGKGLYDEKAYFIHGTCSGYDGKCFAVLCTCGRSCFSDVPDNVWYKNAVDYVAENELFAGNGDGTFSPKGSMTRAMFVTVLSRIADADVSTASDAGFDDVSNTWYTDCVNWPEIRTKMASAFICAFGVMSTLAGTKN